MTSTDYIAPGCRILGIDTGLATMGWALLGAGDDDDLGAWTSESEASKRGITRAEDLAQRGCELARHVAELVMQHAPDLIAVEALSIPRSAKTAVVLGVGWGALRLQLEHIGIPVVSMSPQEVRRALHLPVSASKEETTRIVDPSGLWRERAEGLLRKYQPHALDAVAIATAAARTDAYRLLMAGRAAAMRGAA